MPNLSGLSNLVPALLTNKQNLTFLLALGMANFTGSALVLDAYS